MAPPEGLTKIAQNLLEAVEQGRPKKCFDERGWLLPEVDQRNAQIVKKLKEDLAELYNRRYRESIKKILTDQ